MQPARPSSTESSEVTALIDSLKKTLSASDPAAPATRAHLKGTAEKLSIALETPGDTVQRIAYYVSLISIVAMLENASSLHQAPIISETNKWININSPCKQPSFESPTHSKSFTFW